MIEDISHRWGDGDLDDDSAERLELEADERYCSVVPDDGVLSAAFEARYGDAPQEFAPLG